MVQTMMRQSGFCNVCELPFNISFVMREHGKKKKKSSVAPRCVTLASLFLSGAFAFGKTATDADLTCCAIICLPLRKLHTPAVRSKKWKRAHLKYTKWFVSLCWSSSLLDSCLCVWFILTLFFVFFLWFSLDSPQPVLFFVLMSSVWALDWATASLLCVYACLAFWVLVISQEKNRSSTSWRRGGEDEDPNTQKRLVRSRWNYSGQSQGRENETKTGSNTTWHRRMNLT